MLVFVVDQFEHSVDDTRAADLGQRVGGARAHPPVAVLQHRQQVFDRVGIADLVEHFHRGAAGVFVLVLQRGDQVSDGIRMIQPHQDLDRLVLYIDVRIGAAAGA